MTKTAVTAGALGALGAAVWLARSAESRTALAKVVERGRGRLRGQRGTLRGVVYRLRGDHPDPDVADDVLADRVRSALGGAVARLDLPHPHVTVERGIVLLHGDVAQVEDATELCDAALKVSGVRGVRSHLHIGLLPGDTRPSVGARGER